MNLDEAAVGRLLHMQEVIPQMERALAAFSSGKVVQPLRQIVPVAEHGGFLGLMPAYTGDALGVKLVTFYPQNPQNRALPTHHAMIQLFKPQTGEVLSEGTEGIALWMLDTDYNEESFFVRHAYFLGANDPYKALKTTLKAEIDQEAWATLYSDTSRPFEKPGPRSRYLDRCLPKSCR